MRRLEFDQKSQSKFSKFHVESWFIRSEKGLRLLRCRRGSKL